MFFQFPSCFIQRSFGFGNYRILASSIEGDFFAFVFAVKISMTTCIDDVHSICKL